MTSETVLPTPVPSKVSGAHPVRDMLVMRMLWGLATIAVVAVIVYFATTVLPGDAANAILGRSATPERAAALRAELGLDRPLVERFFSWVVGALQGDFGNSLAKGQPVTAVMGDRLVNSAVLMVSSAAVATVIGVMLGIHAALHRDGMFDSIGSVASLIASALPEFVVAIFVVMLLAVNVLVLFPGVSILPPGTFIWEEPSKLVLPVISLVIVTAPYIFRMTRAAMIEALESDYVEACRLKGASERRVAFRHAFPNALAPVIQVVGLTLLYLAGGIILVETVFTFPGLGTELVQAVAGRDVPIIQFTVLVLAVFYVVMNILTDLVVLLVTPRKRFPR
ncbi:ABC-type dipeptide/oligopeptide/nickel transport system, permease component [Mycolicibacterium tokaiense]|uniref:ABC-type dipeptide/oligopeptide/nickel transport system, permease component n=2 Tax=Mycolicibacterium tokaiense TaxID=39695 RepID=A0A378TCK2_9MYCO|nr:ABC-type dipeptide/oligopeptide/nickel transport system, permease component [Mycolicibacterium tokaiense]